MTVSYNYCLHGLCLLEIFVFISFVLYLYFGEGYDHYLIKNKF